MFKRMPSLKALRAFEAAARYGSFKRAATELALTPGAISYQVRQLESHFETALFIRKTRQIVLTQTGKDLFHTTTRLSHEFDHEMQRVFPKRAKSMLTMGVSTNVVTRWLGQRLGSFLNAQPRITINLQHSVNEPDFNVSHVDLAIRWGVGQWPDSESELLISLPMIALCSPGLLSNSPGHKQPQELLKHVTLHGHDGDDYWPLWMEAAGLNPQQLQKGPMIFDPHVRIQLAIDGQGFVIANHLCQSDIDAGLLIEPFGVWAEGYGYYLVHERSQERSEPFRLFRDWLRVQIKSYKAELSNLAQLKFD